MTKANKNGQAKAPSVTPRQERAMHALLAGLDDTAAARAAGVQRTTLNKWKNHDADFIGALNIARRDLAESFTDSLRALYGDAVAVIRDALDPEQSINVRLRAAEALLKNMSTTEGETDPDAIRARWETEHAEAARAQDIARFIAPITAMLD